MSNQKSSDRLPESIGSVCMAWGGLEFGQSLILAELLEAHSDTAQIVSTLLGYRHSRNLITSLAAIKLKGAPSKAKLTSFLGQTKGMYTERNKAVHALWHEDEKTGRLNRITIQIRSSYQTSKTPVAPGHMLKVADRMEALLETVPSLAQAIRRDVKAWRRKSPSPDLPHRAPGPRSRAAKRDKP